MRSWACATSRRDLISPPQPRQPRLTVDLLHQAWRDIKRAKVVNFLDHLRAQEGVGHA